MCCAGGFTIRYKGPHCVTSPSYWYLSQCNTGIDSNPILDYLRIAFVYLIIKSSQFYKYFRVLQAQCNITHVPWIILWTKLKGNHFSPATCATIIEVSGNSSCSSVLWDSEPLWSSSKIFSASSTSSNSSTASSTDNSVATSLNWQRGVCVGGRCRQGRRGTDVQANSKVSCIETYHR